MPWLLMTRALGLSEGGYVRSALEGLWAAIGLDAGESGGGGARRAAFTIAFVALAAKMAKADGFVAGVEAATFERLSQIAPGEVENMRHVFDLAAGDTAGYDTYASQIREALKFEPRVLRDVLDALFHIAAADGVFHGREEIFLADVAGIFGISDAEFRSIRAAFVRDGRAQAGDDPYAVLGVSSDVGEGELRAHYLRLVRDHHPDSLTARGVPREFHCAAERKLAVINAAYDRIMALRSARPAIGELASNGGPAGAGTGAREAVGVLGGHARE